MRRAAGDCSAPRRNWLSIRFFFFFNDTATTEIYTLSLHDALPISLNHGRQHQRADGRVGVEIGAHEQHQRSEEHTSELQSQSNLVCRLLLEKKKQLPAHMPYLLAARLRLAARRVWHSELLRCAAIL